MSIPRFWVPSLATPRIDLGGCVFYAPLWHPTLGGTTFQSKDKYGHLCTVTGALWRPNGRYFDGIDDFITTGDTTTFKWMHGALDTTGFQLSVLLWLSLLNPKNDALSSLLDTYSNNSASVGIMLTYDDRSAYSISRKLGITIARGVSGTTVTNAGANNNYPNDANFHFVAFSHNQGLASNNTKIYVDCVEVASANKSGNVPSMANSTYALRIGRFGDNTSPLGGNIGEIFVYNCALTPLEIQHNYLRTKWRYQ